MTIKRLRIQGFGRFREPLDVNFGGGLEVALGPNESGKSTLLEAIVGTLFGLEDRAAEERYAPTDGGPFAAELELTTGECDWHVSRDFRTHRVTVTRRRKGEAAILFEGDANPRGRTDDLLAYQAVLEEMTGFTDRDMGLATLFMRQGAIETAVDEDIRQLLTGSSRGDYDAVVGRLEDRYFALTRENPWGRRKSRARELEDLDEKITALAQRLERSRAALRQGGALVSEMEGARESLQHLRSALVEKTVLFDAFREFFETNNERSGEEKRLRVLREEKEKVKALVADCERAETELARFQHLRGAGPEFGERLRALSMLERDVQELEADFRRREADLAANPWPRQTKRNLIIAAGAAVLAGLATLGAGVGWISALVGLVVGALTVAGLHLLGSRREQERMRLEAQVIELEERLEKQKAEKARAEADVRPVIGARRLQDALEEWRQYCEQTDLLSRHEQIRDSHRALPAVEADYDDVFQKLKIADSRARDLIARAPYLAGADENLEAVAARVEQLRREKEELAGQERSASERVEELKLRQARQEGSLVDDAESLEDELTELRERQAAVAFRRDALKEAVDTLRACVAEFQEGHVERLAQRAGDLLARVTGGRWPRLVLDRQFVPALVDTDGRTFELAALSQGTRDQLHLALRVAIVEEIFRAGTPPLLVDDVLVNCDESRRAAIRRLFEDQAAAGRQILLFTHDPSFAAWGRVAIELTADGGAATARGAAAASAAPPPPARIARRG
jgi:DNA repair exonuclease SbcCD ATPase subunit